MEQNSEFFETKNGEGRTIIIPFFRVIYCREITVSREVLLEVNLESGLQIQIGEEKVALFLDKYRKYLNMK